MRLLRLLRSLWRQEFGQGLVLGSMAMVVILGFAALVLDVGMFLHEKAEIQKAVDAAALAAAQKLPDSWAAAQTDANAWLAKNDAGAALGDTISISFTCTSQFQVACDPAASKWDTIVIRAERKVPLNFAPLLGVDDVTVKASAGGCRGLCGASPYTALDVMMVLDRTLSMSSSDVQKVKNGAKAILGVFDDAYQHVGLGASPAGKKATPCNFPSNIGSDPNNPDWTLVGLSDDYQNPGNALVSTIDCLKQPSKTYAQTNLGDPLLAARDELMGSSGRLGVPKGVILLSDGAANRPDNGPTSGFFYLPLCGPEPDAMNPCQYAVDSAQALKNQGIEIFTIGYGIAGEYCECDNGTWKNKPARDLLKAMATDQYHYFEEPKGSSLTSVFQQIGVKMVTDLRLVSVSQ
jgi:Flp pilus assembly protein TadG